MEVCITLEVFEAEEFERDGKCDVLDHCEAVMKRDRLV